MTITTRNRLLLAALAIVAVAVAAPLVSAHGTDTPDGNATTAEDTHFDGDADDWAAWMGEHMTEHMGSEAIEWMESMDGVDGTGQDMADAEADNETVGHAEHGGMGGQGHC